MPAFILRVTPNRDLYVEWSTVVEDVTRTGTRAEFCRDRRPDDSAKWCYACVASAALEAE